MKNNLLTPLHLTLQGAADSQRVPMIALYRFSQTLDELLPKIDKVKVRSSLCCL
jgi:hypothetical protein